MRRLYCLAVFLLILLSHPSYAKAHWTYYGAVAANAGVTATAIATGNYGFYPTYYGYGYIPNYTSPYMYVGRTPYVNYKSYEPLIKDYYRSEIPMLTRELEARKQAYMQKLAEPTLQEQKAAEYDKAVQISDQILKGQ